MYIKKFLPLCYPLLISACSTPSLITALPTSEKKELMLSLPRANQLIAVESSQQHTDLWEHLRQGMGFPVVFNERVVRARQQFLNDRHYFSVVSKRAEPFLAYIVAEIKRRDMPLDLALLPFVESAFDVRAVSQDRAAGVWQFMDITSRRFQLHRDSWYDGRLDIHASTHAALDYLSYLHRYFDGDWLHAIAAYNSGEGRVRRAIVKNKKDQKPTDFWSLSLPDETKDYIPRLLALKDLIVRAEHFHLKLPPLSIHSPVRTVYIEKQLDLNLAAKMAGITIEKLQRYNPGLLRDVTSPTHSIHLIIPHQSAQKLQFALDITPHEKWMRWHTYQVKSGDSLSAIARRFRVQVRDIQKHNALKDHMIYANMALRIPVTGHAMESDLQIPTRNKTRNENRKHKEYIVKQGDALWTIAKAHGIEVKQLRMWNQLNKNKHIKPGQVLALFL